MSQESLKSVFLIGFLFLCLVMGLSGELTAQSLRWVPRGSAPNTGGQVENVSPDNEVAGAINAVAPHPTNANILYVGAVNGGIWKTENAMAPSPDWTIQTNDKESLAIGALEFDPTDSTHMTLVAGTGGFSSFGAGGARVGVLRTTDGGTTWGTIDGSGVLAGLNISGVAPRGNIIVISAVPATNSGHEGVWRSTDTGTTWTKISGGPATGLPNGRAFDLASVAGDPTHLFTNAGGTGIYRSTDAGATWTKVSTTILDNLLTVATNIKIAVGTANNINVAVVESRQLAGVFRSGDNGNSWSQMDLPRTAEGGIHPGLQGNLHLSLVADPTDPNVVYIGGDRQDRIRNFPNSIGARGFTGRLFRGDASKPAGQQWVHLTHSNTQGPTGGGTASSSSPHADSRDMAFAANGVLIEGDDGGVYRRTAPRSNAGDWFSMNGNLQTSEYHAVAWDSNAHVVVAAAQDTGTSEQLAPANTRFRTILVADGGIAAVDDTSTPGRSVRYASFQSLGSFSRRVFDASNNLLSSVRVPLTVLGGGASVVPQFYTPIALNTVTATRLVIGASNSVYESRNQGDTVHEIGPGIVANGGGLDPIAYGATGNPDALYVGSQTRVFVRTAPFPAPLVASATYPGGFVMSIAIDPGDPEVACVVDPSSVFQTMDAGSTWTDLSGNLSTLKPGILRAVTYIPGTPGSIVVGSDTGVIMRPISGPSGWIRLGTGLPRVPVYHLEYDSRDDILLAGTLGRGAWTLDAPTPIPQALAALTAGNTALIAAATDSGTEGNIAMAASKTETFSLRDGVIVDLVQQLVFLMHPDGGIDAARLDTGATVWSTKKADKPLEVSGTVLIGQAAAPPDANAVQIIALNKNTGDALVGGMEELPPDIVPSIDETLKGTFMATARTTPGNVLVTWQFRERPASGIRPGADAGLAPSVAMAAPTRIGVRSGTFRMDLASGNIDSLNVAAPATAMVERATGLDVPQADRLEGIEGEQFLSVDRRNIVVSERTGDDTVWEKYTLTIFDRQSKRQIGQLKSHLAVFPVFVSDSRAVFESGPYSRRTEAGFVEEPLKIRAVDLENGQELWSRPIRDTTYQGPFPP